MFETRVVETREGAVRAASLGHGPDVLVLHTLRGRASAFLDKPEGVVDTGLAGM